MINVVQLLMIITIIYDSDIGLRVSSVAASRRALLVQFLLLFWSYFLSHHLLVMLSYPIMLSTIFRLSEQLVEYYAHYRFIIVSAAAHRR